MKDRFPIKRIATLLLWMTVLVRLSAFAETGTVVTDGGRLNIRKSPDGKAKIVMKIRNGQTVEVLDRADGWVHITSNGQEGYAMERYIRMITEAVGKEIYTNGMTVYLREQADDSSRITGMVNARQLMTVEQVDDEWALVSSNGAKGYVRISDIDRMNEEPEAEAVNVWGQGILKAETALYADADKKSPVLSTWPKGTAVLVTGYNRDWSLIQVAEEGVCGFARKVSVELSPVYAVDPDGNQIPVTEYEVQYISVGKAQSVAEKALKKYSGFNAKLLTCIQDSARSADGIQGPLYLFNYKNKKGQYVYAAYVHAVTGEILYTGNYTDYAAKTDVSDLKTAPPATTQEPAYVYDENGNIQWSMPPEVRTGTDIGKNAARSVADRWLSAKYPSFSQMKFSRVNCRHATDPADSNGFCVPYYQFDYYVNDGEIDQLTFEIIIDAYTKEIEYCSGSSYGEGNG